MCPGAKVTVPLVKRRQKKAIDPTKNQCTICSKSFAWPGRLARHMLSHTGERPHVCNICGKGFTEQGHLRRHALIHSGVRPYGCSMCTLRFIEKGTLKRHMLTHTGEKSHACKICRKKFGREENLKTHMFIHTGERPRSCAVCAQRFAQASTLQRHMSTHYMRPMPPAVEQPPSGFYLKTEDADTAVPMLVDSKEGITSTPRAGQFGCQVCNNRFTQFGHLKVHMLMHVLHLIPEQQEEKPDLSRPSSHIQPDPMLAAAA